MNIQDNFVSYEIALQMKEIGFDWECFGRFNEVDSILITESNDLGRKKYLQAPLFQQCIEWFREKHDMNISFKHGLVESWSYEIYLIIKTVEDYKSILNTYSYDCKFQVYNDCQSAAILKVIQIIKERNNGAESNEI